MTLTSSCWMLVLCIRLLLPAAAAPRGTAPLSWATGAPARLLTSEEEEEPFLFLRKRSVVRTTTRTAINTPRVNKSILAYSKETTDVKSGEILEKSRLKKSGRNMFLFVFPATKQQRLECRSLQSNAGFLFVIFRPSIKSWSAFYRLPSGLSFNKPFQ